MSSVSGYSSIKYNLESIASDVKNIACLGALALAAVVVAVVHPIIGPLGVISCLFAAIYHGLALNYHWRHSREKNEQGQWIAGTGIINQPEKNPYTNRNPIYNLSDLPRLRHEVKRLNHERAATEYFKWIRGFAKFSVPLIGPIWALATEINVGGSIEMSCCGCTGDHWKHESDKNKVERHIAHLTQLSRV